MNAIVLAAGTGTRTNLEYPKQLMDLGGKPLFIHSLDLLRRVKDIDKIHLTVIPDMLDEFRTIALKNKHKDIIYVPGGKLRQESVYNALSICDSKRVLIHAASRPFVTCEHIEDLISVEANVVIPCVPMIMAVYHKDGHYIDRDKVLCIQLPQIFDTDILKKAHELGKGKNYAEDSGLVYGELGILPTIIEGLEQNIKITLSVDVKCAKVLFSKPD